MDSPEIEAVIKLPASLPPEQVDFISEQLGRIAEAVHEGRVVAVVEVPVGVTAEQASAYSDALTVWSDTWWESA